MTAVKHIKDSLVLLLALGFHIRSVNCLHLKRDLLYTRPHTEGAEQSGAEQTDRRNPSSSFSIYFNKL